MTEAQREAQQLEQLMTRISKARSLISAARENGAAMIPISEIADPIMIDLRRHLETLAREHDKAAERYKVLLQSMTNEERDELRINRIFH